MAAVPRRVAISRCSSPAVPEHTPATTEPPPVTGGARPRRHARHYPQLLQQVSGPGAGDPRDHQPHPRRTSEIPFQGDLSGSGEGVLPTPGEPRPQLQSAAATRAKSAWLFARGPHCGARSRAAAVHQPPALHRPRRFLGRAWALIPRRRILNSRSREGRPTAAGRRKARAMSARESPPPHRRSGLRVRRVDSAIRRGSWPPAAPTGQARGGSWGGKPAGRPGAGRVLRRGRGWRSPARARAATARRLAGRPRAVARPRRCARRPGRRIFREGGARRPNAGVNAR